MANEIINIEMLKINNDKVKTWVENKIKDIGHLTIKKVDVLPTEDIDPYCIYFVPKGRVCDEYMYIDDEWELLGSSDADLSNYYTKDETDELITAHNERETAHEDIRGLIDDTNTKIGEFGDLKTTAKSSVVSAINSVYNKQIKAISTGDNGEMVFEKNDDTTMEFPLIDTVMGNIPLGEANGIATLDANGKVPATQIPTSAVYIAGKIDAENNHTLPSEADYTDGAEIVVISNGYVNQSTAFTLPKNTTLTDFEVVQANTLIGYGYVFSVSGGVSGHIGTVKEFQNDKLILSDDSEFNLPVNESLSAVSIPSTVQKPCVIGDIFMLIDGHWAYMNNTSSVSSVNGKTGAVTIAEYNPTNKPQLEKIGENAEGNLTYNGEEIKGGSDEFVGTKAEWEALSTEEKAKYDGKKLNFTDSEGENLIDDTAPANNKVYSSSKVESLLTGIGTIYRANWTKTEASEVNEDLTEELTLGKGNYILIAQIPFVNAVDGVRLYSIYNKTDFIYESFAMSQYSYASFLAVISIDSTKTYAIKDSGGAVSTGYDARYIDRGYLKAIKLDA